MFSRAAAPFFILKVILIKTDQCFFFLFTLPGSDSIYAGGRGGSKVHRPPGPRAPMGDCKYGAD